MLLVSDPNRAGAIRGAKPGNDIFLCSFPPAFNAGTWIHEKFRGNMHYLHGSSPHFSKIPAAVERKTMSAGYSIHALHKLGALSTNSSMCSIARNADDYADPTR